MPFYGMCIVYIVTIFNSKYNVEYCIINTSYFIEAHQITLTVNLGFNFCLMRIENEVKADVNCINYHRVSE